MRVESVKSRILDGVWTELMSNGVDVVNYMSVIVSAGEEVD